MKASRILFPSTLTAVLLAFGLTAQSSGVSAAQATMAATMSSTMAMSAATMSGTMAGTQVAYDRTDWPTKLTIGIFGGEDSTSALTAQKPIQDYLTQKLGITVNAITGTSYTAVIEAMKAGQADAFEVGPFSYLFAVQEANAEAIAVQDNPAKKGGGYDATIKPYYYSVILTVKGSGIKSLKDIKGHSFSFVDPASTSGHLMPASLLLAAGINPEASLGPIDPSSVIYAGSHPASLLAIYNKKVDAGATYEQNWTDATAAGTVQSCVWPDGQINKSRTQAEIDALYASCPDGKLVPIAISAPIPNTPFAVRANLPASLKAAIKDALLAIKDNDALVKTSGRWYVDPTSDLKLKNLDAFYDPLRQIATLLKLDLKALASPATAVPKATAGATMAATMSGTMAAGATMAPTMMATMAATKSS